MAVDDVYPRRNLPASAENWGRTIESEVKSSLDGLRILRQDVSGQNRATAASLQELSNQLITLDATVATLDATVATLDDTVATLDDTVATLDTAVATLDDTVATLDATVTTLDATVTDLADAQARIEDASQVYYSDSGSNTWTLGGSAEWATTPATPSITASSLSGRFRVTVSGSANNAIGAVTFSAPGYSRSRAEGGSSSAVRSRVTVGGGASYVATASGSWVVTLAANTSHTFLAEFLNLTGTPSYPVYVFSLTLQVEPLL